VITDGIFMEYVSPNFMPRSAMEDEIRLRYDAIRRGIPGNTPITVLQIGAEQTVVATGTGVEPKAALTLAIGSRVTAGDYFKHFPPTPGEMENAIQSVEDEVAHARAIVPGGSVLLTADTAISEIARIAGVPDQPVMALTIEAVERVFSRLTTVSLGRPASQEGVPTNPAFAATLLILREFMHHLQFPSITVRS